MFDRGNGSYLQEKALPVRIELTNGQIMGGNIVVSQSASLREAINDNKQYLEFTTYDGKQNYISKHSIIQIEKVNRPEEANQLMGNFNKINAHNPFAILGLATSADKEEVQKAYHRLAKEYHPDRFVNVELPSEAMQYLIAMSKRINAAHTELSEMFSAQARAHNAAL